MRGHPTQFCTARLLRVSKSLFRVQLLHGQASLGRGKVLGSWLMPRYGWLAHARAWAQAWQLAHQLGLAASYQTREVKPRNKGKPDAE